MRYDESKIVQVGIRFSNDSVRSLGHATLKTFTGGENKEGIYVSYFPSCSGEGGCNQSRPHFHQEGQDRMRYQQEPEPPHGVKINLIGLDVEKINWLFLEMKSYFEQAGRWTYISTIENPLADQKTTNCSSLVLYLLRVGGLQFSYTHDSSRIRFFILMLAACITFGGVLALRYESTRESSFLLKLFSITSQAALSIGSRLGKDNTELFLERKMAESGLAENVCLNMLLSDYKKDRDQKLDQYIILEFSLITFYIGLRTLNFLNRIVFPINMLDVYKTITPTGLSHILEKSEEKVIYIPRQQKNFFSFLKEKVKAYTTFSVGSIVFSFIAKSIMKHIMMKPASEERTRNLTLLTFALFAAKVFDLATRKTPSVRNYIDERAAEAAATVLLSR